MARRARLLAAVATLALALAPALAEARPGGGSSGGSRGARTHTAPAATQTAPGQARPMERSLTEPARPAAAGAARPGGLGGRFGTGLMGGLMGGLLGAGLFGLLTGSGFLGGLSGLAGFVGLLLQVGLVVLLARLAWGFFRRRQQAAPAGMPRGMDVDGPARGAAPGPSGGPGVGGMLGGLASGRPAAPVGEPIAVGRQDLETFEGMLRDVNAAWTRGDRDGLRRLCTPEMAGYFEQEMAGLIARGLRNETRDLSLEQGDLSEGWREGARDYATVAMRFSLIDVTRRLADDAVVEGDPARRTQATELWTFVRPTGGRWVLSAIQQTG